jgi:hypothetical protein
LRQAITVGFFGLLIGAGKYIRCVNKARPSILPAPQ